MKKPVYAVLLLSIQLTAFFSCNNPTVPDDKAGTPILEKDSIEIFSPIEGDIYSDTLPVRWTSTLDSNKDVKIHLYRNNTVYKNYDSKSFGKSFNLILNSGYHDDTSYNLKIVSKNDSSIVAWSGPFTIKGDYYDDIYEPDDRSSKASIVKPGTMQIHTISNVDDDWIKIPVSKNDSLKLTIDTYYATWFYVYWASELRSGNAGSNYKGGGSYEKTLSGVNDTLLVNISKSQPLHSTLTGPESSFHEYTVKVNDLKDTSFGAFFIPDSGKTFNEGDTVIASFIGNSDGILYLYRDDQMVTEIGNDQTAKVKIPLHAISGEYHFRYVSPNQDKSVKSNTFIINGTGSKDKYEDDDHITAAHEYELDVLYDRTLHAFDTEWLKIPAKINDFITLTLKGDTNIAAKFYTGPQDTLLSKETQDSAGFSVSTASPLDGYIYARIRRENSSVRDSAPYSFSVSVSEQNSILTAEIENSKDGFTAGDTIIVKPSSNTGSVFRYYLLKSGKIIGEMKNHTGYSSDTLRYILPIGPPAGNDYNVKVVNYNDRTIHTYTETFSIISDIENDDHDNVDPMTAWKITEFNSPVRGVLLAGEKDWFTFNMETGYRYALTLKAENPDVFPLLYKPGQSTLINFEKQLQGFDTQVYFSISGVEGGGGPYEATVHKVSTEELITITKPVEGAHFLAGDSLLYEINSVTLSERPIVRLYRDSIWITTLPPQHNSLGEHTWDIPSGLPTSDNYRIKAEDPDGATSAWSGYFTISGIPFDEYETNDSMEIATLIPADFFSGDTVSGSLHADYRNDSRDIDEDWYKIPVEYNSYYEIFSPDVSLGIYDKSKNELINGWKIRFMNDDTTDTIYIQVKHHLIHSSYSISGSVHHNDKFEYNNTISQAYRLDTSFIDSDTLEATLLKLYDYDWFRIDVRGGVLYSFDSFAESCAIFIRLTDEDEVPIDHGIGNVEFTPQADMTVFIELTPSAGVCDYSFSISTVD